MASDFLTIPVDLQIPGSFTEFNSSQAFRGTGGLPHKLLILGQLGSTSPAPRVKADTIHLIPPGHEEAHLGQGCLLTAACEAARRVGNFIELYALPMARPAAAKAASAQWMVTGTAQEQGTLHLYVAGRYRTVAVEKAETAETVMTSVHQLLTDDKNLLVSSELARDKSLTLKAKDPGTIGNGLSLQVNLQPGQLAPSGLVVPEKVILSGGTGAPLGSAIVEKFGDVWWTELVSMWGSDAALNASILQELARRDGGTLQKAGVLYRARVNTQAELSKDAQNSNSRHESLLGVRDSATPEGVLAASYAMSVAVGASASPGRPLQYTWLPGVLGGKEVFTDGARNQLLKTGVSTVRQELNGQMFIERAVTTRTKNESNNSDYSWQDVADLNNLRYLRWSLNNRLLQRYRRARLGHDSDPARRGVVRPSDVRAELVALATEWLNNGYIQNLEAFKAGLSVQPDPNHSGRVLIHLAPTLIGQLRQFFSSINFRL